MADKNDVSAFQELLEHHPKSDLPSCSAPESASLTVDKSAVVMCLKGFPRGTSPGVSGLHVQHLVDVISGRTTSYVEHCLLALTKLMNFLLSGKVSPLLAPWICGTPLTALLKKNGGVRLIAVGEVLRCLASCGCALCMFPKILTVY